MTLVYVASAVAYVALAWGSLDVARTVRRRYAETGVVRWRNFTYEGRAARVMLPVAVGTLWGLAAVMIVAAVLGVLRAFEEGTSP